MSEKVVLCTLALNEMEWLPRLYEQHKDWPGMVQWVFVEAADRVYAQVNKDLVSSGGLSVDGTTEFLEKLSQDDPRVVHIRHGFSSHSDPALGKCESRNRYLRIADKIEPNFLFIIDGDEFFTRSHQGEIMDIMRSKKNGVEFSFSFRNIWRPESVLHLPLMSLEVVGGFWGMHHTRGYRWTPGMSYENNHNSPARSGRRTHRIPLCRVDQIKDSPCCVHLGFAAKKQFRKAKNSYYIARGEGVDPRRQWYTVSRACFESWKPGDNLPFGSSVVPYTGDIPEVFLEDVSN